MYINQTHHQHVDTCKSKHIKIKENTKRIKNISPSYDNSCMAPTTLMKLSERDFKRYKDNYTNVSGIS